MTQHGLLYGARSSQTGELMLEGDGPGLARLCSLLRSTPEESGTFPLDECPSGLAYDECLRVVQVELADGPLSITCVGNALSVTGSAESLRKLARNLDGLVLIDPEGRAVRPHAHVQPDPSGRFVSPTSQELVVGRLP